MACGGGSKGVLSTEILSRVSEPGRSPSSVGLRWALKRRPRLGTLSRRPDAMGSPLKACQR